MEIANAILRPEAKDFMDRFTDSGNEVMMGQILIEGGSELEGRTLEDWGRNEARHVSFVGHQREGDLRVPPRGPDVLLAKDILLVAGHPEELARLRLLARPEPDPGS